MPTKKAEYSNFLSKHIASKIIDEVNNHPLLFVAPIGKRPFLSSSSAKEYVMLNNNVPLEIFYVGKYDDTRIGVEQMGCTLRVYKKNEVKGIFCCEPSDVVRIALKIIETDEMMLNIFDH